MISSKEVFTGEQVCQGIAQALGPADRYHLSTTISLEGCLMALDLDTPAMDRGAITVDNMGLWEWRDKMFRNLPETCLGLDPASFAAIVGGIFLSWLCGESLPQESVLCILPLVIPERSGPLSQIARAFWFMINEICDIIHSAEFNKDERAVSWAFYGIEFPQKHPIHSGIGWLDDWQEFFHKNTLNRMSLTLIPELLPIPDTKGLIESLFANVYGIGCPRFLPHFNLSISSANERLEQLNSQFRCLHYVVSRFCDSMPFSGLSEAARLLANFSETACQVVRARAVLILLHGSLALDSILWTASGKTVSERERRYSFDALKILLHSPARQHRLIPYWISGCSSLEHCTFNFNSLLVFMKGYWVELCIKLGLLSPVEIEEAQEWLKYLSYPHVPPTHIKNTRRYKYRWSPLINNH